MLISTREACYIAAVQSILQKRPTDFPIKKISQNNRLEENCDCSQPSLRAQRSNPASSSRAKLDCFAALAMTSRTIVTPHSPEPLIEARRRSTGDRQCAHDD